MGRVSSNTIIYKLNRITNCRWRMDEDYHCIHMTAYHVKDLIEQTRLPGEVFQIIRKIHSKKFVDVSLE